MALSLRGHVGPQRNTEPRLVSAGRTGTGRCLIETAPTHDKGGVHGPGASLPAIDPTTGSFVVIGMGRVGSSLALALRARGARLAGYVNRTPQGRSRAEALLGTRAASSIHDLVSRSPEIYIIAVPDDVLLEVAEELGPRLRPAIAAGHPTPLVLHTSGAKSVHVLRTCEEAGAVTLAFHPLQTFPDSGSGWTRFADAAVAITPASGGDDSPAALFGFALARSLDARPFLLPDENRTLYHAAATVACNYLVTLERVAERLFIRAGLAEEEALSLFFPLLTSTLQNLRARGPAAALTGPLSRGDTGTIARHLQVLAAEEPTLVPLYQVLGLATLDLVRDRGELDPSVIAELADLLSPITTPIGHRSGQQGA